jgi:hypothetical protein
MKNLFHFLLLTLIALAACENEPATQITEIECRLTSTQNEALAENLIFDRGYVHLQRVEVTGLKDGVTASATRDFGEPEQFFFIGADPRQPVMVPIAEATYLDPKVSLTFFQDDHVLIVRDTTYQSDGDGDTPPDGDSGDGDDEEGDDDDDDDDDNDNGDDDDDGENGDDDDESGDDDDDDDDDDGREKTLTGKTADLNDFLLHAKPAVVLLGQYTKNNSIISVIVAVELAAIQMTPSTGDSIVVAQEDKLSAIATFLPAAWFKTVSQQELDAANLIRFRGQPVMLIHKNFNATLHEKLIKNIAESTQLAFRASENF